MGRKLLDKADTLDGFSPLCNTLNGFDAEAVAALLIALQYQRQRDGICIASLRASLRTRFV